ncbi:hypothetical protein GOODEAATRI_019008, partial [Goodea atripinnis]
ERDGADRLLELEKGELMELKRDLEAVLGESSRKLLHCASERMRVLDLVPHRCSAEPNVSTAFSKPEPFSYFTPGPVPLAESSLFSFLSAECKQVFESSSLAVSRSQLLRENIRSLLTGAITRQNAAHRSVNDGLVKKIAETISLQASEGELERLQRSGLQLLKDLRGKTASAQVDASVVRMRREQVDKRAVPAFLQWGRVEAD